MRAKARLWVVAALLLAAAGWLCGAGPGLASGGGAERDQVIATDLIGTLLGQYGLAYEQRLGSSGTLLLSGWYWDMEMSPWNLRIVTADAGLRWYPQGRAPGGFFAGGTVGVHLANARYYAAGSETRMYSGGGTVLRFGLSGGYQWVTVKGLAVSAELGVIGNYGDVTAEGAPEVSPIPPKSYPFLGVRLGYAF